MGEKVIRVGIMPGRINEVAMEIGDSIADVLSVAGLDASGYDVKVNDVVCKDLNATKVTAGTNLVLLVKQVKGN